MNARGATVPFSAGFLEMNRKRDRRAEKSVGGADGMETVAATTGEGTSAVCKLDAFRSSFHRGEVAVAGA